MPNTKNHRDHRRQHHATADEQEALGRVPRGRLPVIRGWRHDEGHGDGDRCQGGQMQALFTLGGRRSLGWRMWWGGPWRATYLVTATKPDGGKPTTP